MGTIPEETPTENSCFYAIEPRASEEKFVGCLDFTFSQWRLGGLISSHTDPSSWSFISDRLLSHICFGPIGSSQGSSSVNVPAALNEAFEATENYCSDALVFFNDERAALDLQLEQLNYDSNSVTIPANQQRAFLKRRSQSCKATLNRLQDCVTTCISLMKNEKELYIANLGDFYATLVSGNGNNNDYTVKEVCTPHDLFNDSEHKRLHSLEMSTAEMNSYLSQIGVYKGFPKFVRCFAGGFDNKTKGPITATPTVVGPFTLDSSGFIAIYNSNFHDTLDQKGNPSVKDIIASKIYPLVNLPSVERQTALKQVINGWVNKMSVEHPIALFVGWFGCQSQSEFLDSLLPPLQIDVTGDNGFPIQAFSGTVVPADSPSLQPASPIRQPGGDVSRAMRCLRPSQQPHSEWIPTYVDLIPASLGVVEGQQNIDAAFAAYARDHLSAEELQLLDL